ncbi:hypothetical protein [Pseudomonas corrugata]|uniref:hypothetical protein n=1 Tax=Pseudomonas corrugata TaxID=47879 RepID=UPI0006D8B644|nr:hypothetical protein [Pseudomonas corrugata]MDU9035345.1 hypothetical protein [Pseudomonas corrugata]
MTVQSKLIDLNGEQLTRQEVAKRSRLAARALSNPLTAPPQEGASIDDQLVDNLIPKSVLDSSQMIVRFDNSKIPVPHDGDEWELYQRKGGDTGAGTEIAQDVFGQAVGRPAETEIPVDTSVLLDDDPNEPSTIYEYQFVVYKGEDGNGSATLWLPAAIDRYAPEQDKQTGNFYKPDFARFTNLSPGSTIDEAWLANNISLNLTVNIAYMFYRPDDTIEIYADTSYGVPGTPIYSGSLASNSISIPKDNLPVLDGAYYLWYKLIDIVGNESELSDAARFNVVRLPPPSLIDCYIPQGMSPDAIDLEDRESGVFLVVPRAINGQDDDRIRPVISNGVIPPINLGNQPLGTSSQLEFPITSSRLMDLWGSSTVEVPVTVRYELVRGTSTPIGSTTIPSSIDFSYRGPDNPDFPDRTNPAMVKVKVVGASGVDDHLSSTDRDATATISTTLVASGSTWTAVGDEIVRLWFNGTEVHSEQLTAGAPPATLTFDMDPNVVDYGLGIVIAYWTIEELGGRNVMKSEDTEVQVDPVLITMPAPQVDLYGSLISCRSLTRGTWELPVTVPIDVSYMPAGTVVTLKSQGYEDGTGTGMVGGTDFTDTHRVTDAEVTAGVFEHDIQPYMTKIRPIQPAHGTGAPRGWIKIWYTVPGVPDPSEELFKEVSLLNSSYNYCEENPTL